MRLPVTVYVLISATFFIFLFALGAIYPEIVNNTKISDWASAIFNGIVAVMAIVAYNVAKDWKLGLTEKEAITEGVNLKTNIIPNVKYKAMGIISANHLKWMFLGNEEDLFYDESDVKSFFSSINELYIELDEFTEELMKLNGSIGLINTYNWNLCSSKSPMLDTIVNSEDPLYINCHSLVSHLNECLGDAGMYFKKGKEIPSILHSSNPAEIKCIIDVLNKFMMNPEFRNKLLSKINFIIDTREKIIDAVRDLSIPTESIHNLIEPKD
ncbi:hypothetical protein ACETTA_05725 [Enterobacter cloacae]|uniref:hypothetical protein n=1 Tax=Enterobacter cloacae TaxID=550 RepID=UPI0018C25981|nr:hypothetical protein [Enterobacter cloacae]MBG0670326.1 hypothetical protein [Enterobacter roggenkampii]MCK7318980.1 hypothetical protein [Enterobacter cloacae]